jgi:hypothetical protein
LSGDDSLAVAVSRLVNQVGHWTPARWSRPSDDGEGTRADLVHRLAQRLADAGADAEGEPRRAVPRLENDLVLVDQVRVLAADALEAPVPDAVEADLVAAVRATAAAL